MLLTTPAEEFQMGVDGKKQVAKPLHQHPLPSFLSPHPHPRQSWLFPQQSWRLEATDSLVTIHGCITVSCSLFCKELVTRNSGSVGVLSFQFF